MRKNLILKNDISGFLLALLGIAYVITRFIKGDFFSSEMAGIQNYGNWFIVTMIVCCAGLAIQLCKNQIMKRMMLAVALFFMTGSMVYLVNIPELTYYYNIYVRVTIFISLLIVGIITTFCSSAGFIGVISDDKKTIKKASLTMLFFTVVCTLWSVGALWYGLPPTFTLYAPLFAWVWMNDIVVYKVRGKKRAD